MISEKKLLVKTYWRDSHNPYPGRMTDAHIEIVPVNKQVRTLTQIVTNPQDQDERNIARLATLLELEKHNHDLDEAAERFEDIADQALETEYR